MIKKCRLGLSGISFPNVDRYSLRYNSIQTDELSMYSGSASLEDGFYTRYFIYSTSFVQLYGEKVDSIQSHLQYIEEHIYSHEKRKVTL